MRKFQENQYTNYKTLMVRLHELGYGATISEVTPVNLVPLDLFEKKSEESDRKLTRNTSNEWTDEKRNEWSGKRFKQDDSENGERFSKKPRYNNDRFSDERRGGTRGGRGGRGNIKLGT
jgi:hypothetical protein